MKTSLTLKILAILVLAGVLFGGGWWAKTLRQSKNNEAKTTATTDKYVAFELEVWDKIKENYWDKISDDDLSGIYLLAIDKISGGSHSLKTRDRNGVEVVLNESLKEINPDKKKEFIATLADTVLANLKPAGRSRLYSQKDQKTLSNVINNVNPGSDYFSDLGVSKTATANQIAQAYKEKIKELEPNAKVSTTAAEKLMAAKQAYRVLKDDDSKQLYSATGVEPTIDYRLIGDSIFYMHLKKFSPTSLEEFARDTAKVDLGNKLDTLIWDLRGNIGGAIDSLPYWLGPFIGPETLGYQFYHQGDKENYMTKTGWLQSLLRYKKVVILIDNDSQSSAEVMAAALKKYNVGVLVGTTTRGWGTVEKVFPLDHQIADDEKFSLYLVHRVTLRDDGQPIEGRGVEPMISIKDINWKRELLERFNYPEIVKTVEDIYTGK